MAGYSPAKQLPGASAATLSGWRSRGVQPATGFGRDFHASDRTVVGVTVATTIMTPAASLFGGWLARRYSHLNAYLMLGALTGLVCLVTSVAAHTPSAYVVNTITYDAITGVSYTIYGAIALNLASSSPVASTQLGMLGAAMNAGVVYTTAVDGWGYRHGGISGLYFAEGAASLVSAMSGHPYCVPLSQKTKM